MGRPPHFYSAAYMMLRQGRAVLLSRRCNTGFEDGAWGLPAGHLNAGECAVSAAVREAREEIGVIIKPSDVSVLSVVHRTLQLKNGNQRECTYTPAHI
mmetsp:Transcript_47563/g.69731  ORF Transcript_47563/g.69731 Transcript_47563/m.69731 type:complete len:98 (+) Transcript_47563:77-370(+)